MTPANDDGVTVASSHDAQQTEIASVDSNLSGGGDIPPRLKELHEQYEHIPQQMRDAKRWLLRKEKIPHYLNGTPRRGKLDSPEDQKNFGTFEAALEALSTCSSEWGLGFALGPDGTGNHFQGIDLDHLSQRPYLSELQKDLPGYTEISPSGDGCHAIGYGQHIDTMRSNDSGVEVYSKGRYFTVTGECSGGDIEDLSAFVDTRLRPIWKPQRAAPGGNAAVLQRWAKTSVTAEQKADLCSALKCISSDSYGEWVAVGQGLCRLDGGYELWKAWSSPSTKWSEDEGLAKWQTLTGDHSSYKAIFAKAQKLGWVNPRSGASRGEQMTAQPEQLLQPISITDVITNPSPPQVFIWDPYVPEGEVTLFSADGGAGKSFISLMLAVSVAIGRPFLGAPVERRRALFVSLEDRGPTVRRRLASICGEWKIDPAHLDTWLFVVDGTGEAELFSTESRSSGDTTDTYAELRDLISREGIGLVIIDNASNAFGGDEIKRREVNRFLNSLIKLTAEGVAVLLLGHVDKATSRGGKNGGQSYSGSTAWHNAVRSRIALSRLEDRSLLLVHEKGNHSHQQAGGIKLEWPAHQLPVLTGGDSAPNANDPQMDGLLDKERYPPLLAMIAEHADREVFCHTANNSPSSVYATLKSDPSFKAMRIKSDDVRRLLTNCHREKWIEREEYKTIDRKLHLRWTVTPAGRVVASLDPLPVPSAPSAPRELDGTLGTAPQAEPLALAPSGAGGMGGRARTKKNSLGALNADLIIADLGTTKPVIKRGRPRKNPKLPNVTAAAKASPARKGGRKGKSK